MRAHNQDYSSDDDYEYYRQEVGERPSDELLLSNPKRVKFDTEDGEEHFNGRKSNFRGGRNFRGREGNYRGGGRKRNFQENNSAGRDNFVDRGSGSGFKFRKGRFNNKGDRNNQRNFSGKKFESGNDRGANSKFSKPRKVPGGRVFRVRKKN